MNEPTPKYLLVVKVASGVFTRRTPRPESQGGLKVRSVPVGTALYATLIINVDGVDYANLVPQNPLVPEWVRVAEKDHSIEYVDVIKLEQSGTSELADAITLLATAVRDLARK